MKKKILVVILFAILIAWLGHRALHAPLAQEEEATQSDQSQKLEEKKFPETLKVSADKPGAPGSDKDERVEFAPQKFRSFEQHDSGDEKFLEFDRQEKIWFTEVKEIIGNKNFEIYLQMREQCEKEKLVANKEYHDYLRQKFGDKYSYNISENQSIREKNITKKYLADLLKLIGNEQFKKVTAARDLFNEKMRREGKESIQIEF